MCGNNKATYTKC